MNLVAMGIAFLLGHVVSQVFRRHDEYKAIDVTMTLIGLIVIVIGLVQTQ